MNDLNNSSLTVVKRGRSVGKYLLFVRCGSEIPLCLKDFSSNTELIVVLSFYRTPRFPINDDFWVAEGGLSKFHAAKLFFSQEPGLKACDYFAFFDDDVGISLSNLIELFRYGESSGAGLYQAAVAKDSNTFYELLKQKESARGWRETSYVEVMAPVFSREALSRCLDTFDLSISTWGLEFAWFHYCHDLKMGVNDRIVMRHDGMVDLEDGPFYRYLQKMGVDAQVEDAKLRRRFAGPFYIECEVPNIIPVWLKRVYVGVRAFPTKVVRAVLKSFRRA